MKIKITGSSGYIGKLVTNELVNRGYDVSGIERKLLYNFPNKLKDELRDSDILINLTGAPIFQRWTKKNKRIIRESRITTTRNLVIALNELPVGSRPKKFISASAIGIYKAGLVHDEESKKFDEGFLGSVVKNWEKQLNALPAEVQKVIFRIGPVLGKNAKTITNLLLPFKLGLGATIGNGKQPFPFIHEKDLVNAFIWAIEEYKESGVFNLVAPQRITNKEFTLQFAKQLHRPAFFMLPSFILKLMFGKASILLTETPEVSADKITKAGFSFQFPNISSALQEIIS